MVVGVVKGDDVASVYVEYTGKNLIKVLKK